MLKRAFAHLLLVFLFAFTQIGVATHEICHATNLAPHSKQDQNTAAEHCEQCIAYAQLAHAIHHAAFVLPNINTSFEATTSASPYSLASLHTAYAARAPPNTFML